MRTASAVARQNKFSPSSRWRGTTASEGGERGITFCDPEWRILQLQITPASFHSSVLFIFSQAFIKQVLYGLPENKNPTASCGSNLSLRREGLLNPLLLHIEYQIITSCKNSTPPIQTPLMPLPNYFK